MVTGEGEHEPARHRVPVHRRDRRLGQCHQPPVGGVVEVRHLHRRGRTPRGRLHVEPAREERSAAGEDDAAHRLVDRGIPNRSVEVGQQLGRERMGRGPVQAQDEDVAVVLSEDEAVPGRHRLYPPTTAGR